MPIIDTARRTASLASILALSIGGCSTVGPVSIDQGRTPYNEVIQTTSEQQTLLNLVRASKAETPLFMDVTEVDAVTTAQVNVSGTESGLGSVLGRSTSAGTLASSVGAVTAGAQYQESPTVRYQPLLGAALVAQVSTPVSATSLVNLYDSGWPLGSIFDLAVARFTPGFDDYHAALDVLLTLDRYGALVLEAKAPEPAGGPRSTGVRGDVTIGQQPSKDADLVIHFRPNRLRYRFGECDGLGRLGDKATDEEVRAYRKRVEGSAANLWGRLRSLFGAAGHDGIVLSTRGAADGAHAKDPAIPLLRTRSALGMLNAIATEDNLVRFSSREDVDATIDDTAAGNRIATGWRKPVCHESFYRAGDLDVRGGDVGGRGARDLDNRRFAVRPGVGGPRFVDSEIEEERKFGGDRRLILVEVTNTRPADAFVSVLHRDAWYSIQDRDAISKRNLALVAQIATIQAVAPSTGPLIPTIVVGPR